MLSARHFAALLLTSTVAACAPGGSELPNAEEETASDERGLGGATVYQVTRQDYRKCMSPMCGGVFVKAANRQKTTCLDGTKQEDCYVGALDLTQLGFGEEQEQTVRDRALAGEILLTGSLETLQGDIAKLEVELARAEMTEADPTGTFYFVEPSGITCIQAPCPSLRARNLNSTSSKLLTDLDVWGLGLDEAAQSALLASVYAEGVVFAGTIKTVGSKKTLHVSQAYPAVEAEETLALCLGDEACGEGAYCDHTECHSNCPEGMICPAVCYGVCTEGAAPQPEPAKDSCVDACGASSIDASCWCDTSCSYYGDCCGDYAAACQ